MFSFHLFFAQKNTTVPLESFLACYWTKNSNTNCTFCMGYGLCRVVDFQNGRISRIFGVPVVFCTEQLYCSCRIIFSMLLQKKLPHKLPILHGLSTLVNGPFSKKILTQSWRMIGNNTVGSLSEVINFLFPVCMQVVFFIVDLFSFFHIMSCSSYQALYRKI